MNLSELAQLLEEAAKHLRLADAELNLIKGSPARTEIGRSGLSARCRKSLLKIGLEFVEDVIQVSPSEILRCKGFGIASLREIKGWLAPRGLKLKEDMDPLIQADLAHMAIS